MIEKHVNRDICEFIRGNYKKYSHKQRSYSFTTFVGFCNVVHGNFNNLSPHYCKFIGELIDYLVGIYGFDVDSCADYIYIFFHEKIWEDYEFTSVRGVFI